MNFVAKAVRSAAVMRIGSTITSKIGGLSLPQSVTSSLMHTVARPPTMKTTSAVFINRFPVKLFETIQRDSSTLKKRRVMMNKHKRKKRKKLLRMNTKVSRG